MGTMEDWVPSVYLPLSAVPPSCNICRKSPVFLMRKLDSQHVLEELGLDARSADWRRLPHRVASPSREDGFR